MEESSPTKSSSPASPGHVARRLSQRRQWLLLLGLSLVVAAVLAFGWLREHMWATLPDRKDDMAQKLPPGSFRPTPAQLANLKIAPVASVTFRTEQVTDGKIAVNGDRTTAVFSPYSGKVTKVLAKLGDQVKQGQPLLAIEATEFVQGQNDLAVAVNAVKTAQAQVTLAQTNEQRKHGLFDAKGGSLQEWQQSQSDLVAAQNMLRSAETASASAHNRLRILGKTEAEIAAIENGGRIRAEAFLLAPISGVVTDRQVGLGQYIQSSASNPVYSIGDLSTLWLIGNVREADAPLMRRGQAVEVRVPVLPDRVFKARLTYVAPSVDPNSRRLPVRTEVENPNGVLKPEMFASFSIITGVESAAPGVPESAVVYEGDTVRVWVLEQNDVLALRQIRTGRTSAGMVEVASGLTAGERVVIGGTLFIDRAGRGD